MKPTLKQIQKCNTPQNKILLRVMKRQFVTSLDSLREGGIHRLASRINELRKVYELESKWIKTASGKRIKAWRLAK